MSDKLNSAREWNIVWNTPGNLEVHNTNEKICYIQLGETVHVIEAAPVLARIAELELELEYAISQRNELDKQLKEQSKNV